MLRTNLSTRPFYNERAVYLVLAFVAIAALLVASWQVTRVITLSRYKTELNAAIARDQREAEDLTRKAADVRRGMDQKELASVAASAKEANGLIEERTFSWTLLFNQIEATLPEDVMLLAVHPEFKEGTTLINMEIQGRRTEDIDAFFARLEKSGEFKDVQWFNENITEDGLHHMVMHAAYAPQLPQPGIRPAATTPQAAPSRPPQSPSRPTTRPPQNPGGRR
jgi:hypothetical protein